MSFRCTPRRMIALHLSHRAVGNDTGSPRSGHRCSGMLFSHPGGHGLRAPRKPELRDKNRRRHNCCWRKAGALVLRKELGLCCGNSKKGVRQSNDEAGEARGSDGDDVRHPCGEYVLRCEPLHRAEDHHRVKVRPAILLFLSYSATVCFAASNSGWASCLLTTTTAPAAVRVCSDNTAVQQPPTLRPSGSPTTSEKGGRNAPHSAESQHVPV